MKNLKIKGQIFTPNYLVKIILDFWWYTDGKINKKHVIDNSCWEGAFLVEVVKRYCDDFLWRDSNLKKLKKELEIFIHGIEIDCDIYTKCINNLDRLALEYWLNNVKWDNIKYWLFRDNYI